MPGIPPVRFLHTLLQLHFGGDISVKDIVCFCCLCFLVIVFRSSTLFSPVIWLHLMLFSGLHSTRRTEHAVRRATTTTMAAVDVSGE